MMAASTFEQLLQISGKILSSRPHSQGELREKLQEYAGEEAIQRILERLQELGLLNDKEYAYNLAFRRMQHDGWAPNRIVQFLVRRQIAPETAHEGVKSALASIGEEALIERLLMRRLRSASWKCSPRQLSRLCSTLMSGGFSEETVRGALRRHIPTAIWRQLEDGD